MTLIKTYKKYLKVSALIWAVCLIVFALVYFVLMGSQRQIRKSVDKELANSKQEYELAQKAAQEETKVRLNEEIDLLQNKLDDFVLDFKRAGDLTFDISRIAGESKVSSFNVKGNDMRAGSASSDPNNIFEKHIEVSFNARFQEFAMFLNALERHRPVLFVNKFKLSRHNNDETMYQVTLDVAAFVQKQDATKSDEESTTRIVGVKY